MTTYEIMFWIFSVAMLLCALLVVLSVNPVSSAMFLILLLFFMAGLFVLLDAYFLAVIQILVYAGAVMVLFLFVIMLLDVKEPRRWWWRNKLGLVGAPIAAVVILAGLADVLASSTWPLVKQAGVFSGELREVVKTLFTKYLLAFEVASLLLLVATVGVVLLGRKKAD